MTWTKKLSPGPRLKTILLREDERMFQPASNAETKLTHMYIAETLEIVLPKWSADHHRENNPVNAVALHDQLLVQTTPVWGFFPERGSSLQAVTRWEFSQAWLLASAMPMVHTNAKALKKHPGI